MRIILALDGSAQSRVAEALVLARDWPPGSTFLIVTAYDRAALIARGAVGPSAVTDVLDALEVPAAALRRAGHAVEVRLEHGSSAGVLLEAADQLTADLIVVGSRGRSAVTSALLGSVSATLADHAHCPVLVARLPRVSRLLVATDGSDSAVGIPAIFGQWRILRGVPIEVLSVARGLAVAGDVLVTEWGPTHDESNEHVRMALDRHQRLADEIAARFIALGWHAEGHVRSGDPAHEIVAAAHERGCDLVVTGSRGLGDLQRLLVGSVAHDVLLHSHCSVLVMRGNVPARVSEPARVAVGAMSGVQ